MQVIVILGSIGLLCAISGLTVWPLLLAPFLAVPLIRWNAECFGDGPKPKRGGPPKKHGGPPKKQGPRKQRK